MLAAGTSLNHSLTLQSYNKIGGKCITATEHLQERTAAAATADWLQSFYQRTRRGDVLIGVPLIHRHGPATLIQDADSLALGRLYLDRKSNRGRLITSASTYLVEDVSYPSPDALLRMDHIDAPTSPLSTARSCGWTNDSAAFDIQGYGPVTVNSATGTLDHAPRASGITRFLAPVWRRSAAGRTAIALSNPSSLPPEIRLFIFALSYRRLVQ